jgi:hypothetical protein
MEEMRKRKQRRRNDNYTCDYHYYDKFKRIKKVFYKEQKGEKRIGFDKVTIVNVKLLKNIQKKNTKGKK